MVKIHPRIISVTVICNIQFRLELDQVKYSVVKL